MRDLRGVSRFYCLTAGPLVSGGSSQGQGHIRQAPADYLLTVSSSGSFTVTVSGL